MSTTLRPPLQSLSETFCAGETTEKANIAPQHPSYAFIHRANDFSNGLHEPSLAQPCKTELLSDYIKRPDIGTTRLPISLGLKTSSGTENLSFPMLTTSSSPPVTLTSSSSISACGTAFGPDMM